MTEHNNDPANPEFPAPEIAYADAPGVVSEVGC
jgi:hypothetical protein